MSKYRLPLVIEPLEEGGYLATSPAFPGLLVQADTVEEALALAPGVARALIEAMREKGGSGQPSFHFNPPPQGQGFAQGDSKGYLASFGH